jgi:hypothetical protein
LCFEVKGRKKVNDEHLVELFVHVGSWLNLFYAWSDSSLCYLLRTLLFIKESAQYLTLCVLGRRLSQPDPYTHVEPFQTLGKPRASGVDKKTTWRLSVRNSM